MTLRRHSDDAAERIGRAAAKIDELREREVSQEMIVEWISALSDYVTALSEMQSYNNESIHEKLQDLYGRAKVAPATSGKP